MLKEFLNFPLGSFFLFLFFRLSILDLFPEYGSRKPSPSIHSEENSIQPEGVREVTTKTTDLRRSSIRVDVDFLDSLLSVFPIITKPNATHYCNNQIIHINSA